MYPFPAIDAAAVVPSQLPDVVLGAALVPAIFTLPVPDPGNVASKSTNIQLTSAAIILLFCSLMSTLDANVRADKSI